MGASFYIRPAERRVAAWIANGDRSVSEAMAEQLEAEKVGTTLGDEASLEAACRRARRLAKAAPPEEQDHERTA